MSISERLKEERLRLGLSQKAMADAAGTSTRSQISYETGQVKNLPSDYLAALGTLGVDVPYLILGKAKLQTQVGIEELPVFDAYRHATPGLKNAIKHLLLRASPEIQRAVITLLKT